MTREEAISVLERVAHTESKWPGTEDTLEALDMAISAIRQQENVTKCHDLFDEDGGEIIPKSERNVPLTNADRIRAMSDKELAEFLIDLADDGNLKIREWLQQPAEDGHG